MKNKFIREMNLSGVTRYVRPPMITLSGVPGSGKTDVAKELSRQLGIFVLSNDYIRSWYYKESSLHLESREEYLQNLVKRINNERLLRLLLTRTPFVFDADINSIDTYRKLELISKFFRYELIKIRVESSGSEENLRRIQARVADLEKKDSSVLGDNMDYSFAYGENVYYQIIERKPNYLPRSFYDYCIFNVGTPELFQEQICIVANDINVRRLSCVIDRNAI